MRGRDWAAVCPCQRHVIFEKTYQIETPPEPPMRWETYEGILSAEWPALLNSSASLPERAVQSFLEQHPVLVPGAFTVLGSPSGHYPLHAALISQPPLPSLGHRIPDFMWITLNSDTESPLLIEIEAPGKRWFTGGGTPTAELSQALNQIAEWKAWFGVPQNVQAFKSFYRLDNVGWMRRRFRPAYMLIYGRRSEASATPMLTSKRAHLFPEDVVVMTYDRLRPDRNASQLVCMKPNTAGVFTAVSVPPTLEWRPGLAEERADIDGLDVAIFRNKHIALARQEFLVRRLPYWSAWVREKSRVSYSDDAE